MARACPLAGEREGTLGLYPDRPSDQPLIERDPGVSSEADASPRATGTAFLGQRPRAWTPGKPATVVADPRTACGAARESSTDPRRPHRTHRGHVLRRGVQQHRRRSSSGTHGRGRGVAALRRVQRWLAARGAARGRARPAARAAGAARFVISRARRRGRQSARAGRLAEHCCRRRGGAVLGGGAPSPAGPVPRSSSELAGAPRATLLDDLERLVGNRGRAGGPGHPMPERRVRDRLEGRDPGCRPGAPAAGRPGGRHCAPGRTSLNLPGGPVAESSIPMAVSFLDFEQPIAELEAKIEELRHVTTGETLTAQDEITRLQEEPPADDQHLREPDALADHPAGAPPARPYTFARLPVDDLHRLHRNCTATGCTATTWRSSGPARSGPSGRMRDRPPEGSRHQGARAP